MLENTAQSRMSKLMAITGGKKRTKWFVNVMLAPVKPSITWELEVISASRFSGPSEIQGLNVESFLDAR